MSYTIDVYRKHQVAVRKFPDFALFVAFFPQLLAGPIERAGQLIGQIQAPRHIGGEELRQGGWLILWGLFKKVYIADNLAPYVQWAFPLHGAATSWDVYLAVFAFSIQIYCDFSGYSDMARGLARLMGFKLVRNFNLPFFSSNPAQIWQRWHITLSNWFRDYVYNPLLYGYVRHRVSPRWYSLALLADDGSPRAVARRGVEVHRVRRCVGRRIDRAPRAAASHRAVDGAQLTGRAGPHQVGGCLRHVPYLAHHPRPVHRLRPSPTPGSYGGCFSTARVRRS